MQTAFLCFSVLRITSGHRVMLVDRKSALTSVPPPPPPRPRPPPPLLAVVYSTDLSKVVVPVLVLLFVALWFILRGDLFYVLSCVILFLCFSVLLALRLPRLGNICSICACLVLSVSSSSWCLGRGAVCDCGSPWIFLLPFFFKSFPLKTPQHYP